MSTSGTRSYEEAVRTIYATQVTGGALEKAYREREQTVFAMKAYIQQLGLEEEVSRLRVIHVTGTKGKGSTCAYCESILRSYGLRTGMFTSPHLVKINERLRLDGRPVSDEKFAIYFWELYDLFRQNFPTDDSSLVELPGFFRLLTIFALYTVIQEKVDVVILEVGVGGRYDATNLVAPAACVIGTLDLDHCSLLGHTISAIAWEKAGIMKKAVPCFVAPQVAEAVPVLQSYAKEVGTEIYEVSPLPGTPGLLGIAGNHQYINAALAVASTLLFLKDAVFLSTLTSPAPSSLSLSPFLSDRPLLVQGLQTCRWPGRCQILRCPSLPHVAFYIDGAHTSQSMAMAVKWFDETISPSSLRILLFHCSHEKGVLDLFKPLVYKNSSPRFDHVFFCPSSSARPSVLTLTSSEGILEQHALSEGYDLPKLLACLRKVQEGQKVEADKALVWHETLREVYTSLLLYGNQSTKDHVEVVATLETALYHRIKILEPIEGGELSVLVTGSLYLAGDVLATLAPDSL